MKLVSHLNDLEPNFRDLKISHLVPCKDSDYRSSTELRHLHYFSGFDNESHICQGENYVVFMLSCYLQQMHAIFMSCMFFSWLQTSKQEIEDIRSQLHQFSTRALPLMVENKDEQFLMVNQRHENATTTINQSLQLDITITRIIKLLL